MYLIWPTLAAWLEARAAAVLEELGMMVSDAVRILLTRIANQADQYCSP